MISLVKENGTYIKDLGKMIIRMVDKIIKIFDNGKVRLNDSWLYNN